MLSGLQFKYTILHRVYLTLPKLEPGGIAHSLPCPQLLPGPLHLLAQTADPFVLYCLYRE